MSPARWVLTALVAAGLVLRLWGIDFGLPNTLCRPDEAVVLHRALAVAGGDLNPHFFHYPSLHFYVLALALGALACVGWVLGLYAGPQDFLLQFFIDPTPVFVTGRLVSAALGSATVVLTYLVGRRVGGDRAGLSGAALLAVAFLHVRDSHYATVDVPAVFWVLLALLGAVRYLDEGRRRDLWWGAAAMGLAVSTKYNAALFAPALLASPWLTRCRPGRGTAPWQVGVGAAACMAVAYLAGTPWTLLDAGAFWRDIAREGSHFAAGHLTGSPVGGGQPVPISGWWYHLTVSLWHGAGWPVAILGWAGLAWLAVTRRAHGLLLALGAVLYLAVAGSGGTLFLRYALPLVPVLCIAAGALLQRLLRSRGGAVMALATALAAAPAASASWHVDRLLATPDSRLLATTWIEAHVPAGATIALTGSEYGHPRLRRDEACLSRCLSQAQATGAPARRLALERAWAPRIPGPRYDVLTVRPSKPGPGPPSPARTATSVAQLRAAGVDWLVAIEHPLPYSRLDSAWARELMDLTPAYAIEPLAAGPGVEYDPIDAFYLPFAGLSQVDRPGPALRIYRLDNLSSTRSREEQIPVEAGTD